MRFLCSVLAIVLAMILLTGCPNTRFHKDASPRPEVELRDDDGVLLVELVHAAGTNGPALDRWQSLKLVLRTERFDRDAKVHVLGRVLEFDSSAAVFAGVLPAGTYQIKEIEAQSDSRHSIRTHSVKMPGSEKDVIVVAGRLNSLGVLIHATVGNWVWWYPREPEFNLPELVRRLRPELFSLNVPLLVPDELKNTGEPTSRISRAWPTTPIVNTPSGHVLRGAQFGHVYHRMPASAGKPTLWETHDLGSYHAVVDLVPNGSRVYVLLAHGFLYELDVTSGEYRQLATNPPGRVAAINLEDGLLHAIIEEHLPSDSKRLTVRRYSSGDWQLAGEAINLEHSANSILLSDGEALVTSGGRPYESTTRYLHRVSLADGHVTRSHVPVQYLRRLASRTLVGGSAPGRHPGELHISHDNGNTWRKLAHVTPAGWPTLDEHGTMFIPAKRMFNGRPLIYILRHEGLDFAKEDRWFEIARFPTRCEHFMETSVIDDELVVFCGERVFRFEDSEYGWHKEALNEIQSSLP